VRARILLIALALAGCGSGSGGLDYNLRTPPPYVGAAPVAPTGQHPVDRTMTRHDAQQARPVIADWAAAVRSGDVARAAGFFDLPAVIYQSGHSALQVNSPQIAEAFNASLPCGAKLLGTNPEGRYVVATFVLVNVGTVPCSTKGKLARVGFVFGDLRHPRRFTEFWQVANNGQPGPAKRPTLLTPATVSDFS
jgi:hypothetical protein